jgi:hypothetical protein
MTQLTALNQAYSQRTFEFIHLVRAAAPDEKQGTLATPISERYAAELAAHPAKEARVAELIAEQRYALYQNKPFDEQQLVDARADVERHTMLLTEIEVRVGAETVDVVKAAEPIVVAHDKALDDEIQQAVDNEAAAYAAYDRLHAETLRVRQAADSRRLSFLNHAIKHAVQARYPELFSEQTQ